MAAGSRKLPENLPSKPHEHFGCAGFGHPVALAQRRTFQAAVGPLTPQCLSTPPPFKGEGSDLVWREKNHPLEKSPLRNGCLQNGGSHEVEPCALSACGSEKVRGSATGKGTSVCNPDEHWKEKKRGRSGALYMMPTGDPDAGEQNSNELSNVMN